MWRTSSAGLMPIEETAEVGRLLGVGLRIHRDRGIGHHLFQHPDAAAGAQGQGDGIAGTGIELVALALGAAQLQHGPEGAVFDGVDDHPLQLQPAGHQQGQPSGRG